MPDDIDSILCLEATNFFLAAHLAGEGSKPGRVGMALSLGGIITVVLQAPVIHWAGEQSH